jgi:hypothetical protein
MPLYIGVGDTDREYIDAYHRFVDQLDGLGWTPHQNAVVSGGHGWEAWRAEMVLSLRWLGTLWGPAPGMPAPTATSSPSPTAKPTSSPTASACTLSCGAP